MYEIVKTYIVYTSQGEVMLHIDCAGDLHIMASDSDIRDEVRDKYDRRDLIDQ